MTEPARPEASAPRLRALCLGIGGCLALAGLTDVFAQGARRGFDRSARRSEAADEGGAARTVRREPVDGEAERRRLAFEEAMAVVDAKKKEMEAESKRQEELIVEAEREAAAARVRAQAAAAEAAAGRGETEAQRAEIEAFAGGVPERVPGALRERFEPVDRPELPATPSAPPAAPVGDPRTAPAGSEGFLSPAPAPAPEDVEPAPRAAPQPTPEVAPPGGVPVEGNGPAPGAEPQPVVIGDDGGQVIDIDSQEVVFDASGQYGEGAQVVVFEGEVRLTHPQFVLASDRLVAFFTKAERLPSVAPGEEGEEPGNQLERAVALGREVVVTKVGAGGEPQIAKARKATFFADKEEVLLEIWPQVQRGRDLVMAKSEDTVIILRGEEMIVKGPVRTRIVGKGGALQGGEPEPRRDGSAAREAATVIDAGAGAFFNRPAPGGKREAFFEGGIAVANPEYDIYGDDLTAYFAENTSTGDSEFLQAMVRGSKAEARQLGDDGEVARARQLVYLPKTKDIRLEGAVERFQAGEWHDYGERFTMNEASKDMKIEGRSSIRFQPGIGPVGLP